MRALSAWPLAVSVCAAALAAALIAFPAAHAVAQEDAARSCVTLTSVRRTRIVDDRSILFYMRDGSVLHNQLASQCAGLKREGRFTYDVAQRRLCAETPIAVVREIGGQWVPTSTCRIGLFVALAEGEDQDVIDAAEVGNTRPRRRDRGRIEVEAVEAPPASGAAPDPGSERN